MAEILACCSYRREDSSLSGMLHRDHWHKTSVSCSIYLPSDPTPSIDAVCKKRVAAVGPLLYPSFSRAFCDVQPVSESTYHCGDGKSGAQQQ